MSPTPYLLSLGEIDVYTVSVHSAAAAILGLAGPDKKRNARVGRAKWLRRARADFDQTRS